jgi:hypothetical protein
MTRTKLIIGSIGGAIAIQLSFAACFSSSTAPGGQAFDGGIMEALDGMVDALANIVDAATSDAKADTDGGTSAGSSCSCGTTEGTRLRNVYFTATDGTKQLNSGYFYDSQLQTYCQAINWNGGPSYCVPNPPVGLPQQLPYPNIMFTDAACTQPIAVWSNSNHVSGTPVSYVFRPLSAGYALFAIGAATTIPATLYDNEGGASCSATTANPGSMFNAATQEPDSTMAVIGVTHD